MYRKGELQLLETKYTDFIRRQNSQDMATTIKKVKNNSNNNNKTKISNNKNASVVAAAAAAVNNIADKDATANNVGAASRKTSLSSTNSESSIRSSNSSANQYSASYGENGGGGGKRRGRRNHNNGHDENDQPLHPDFTSLVKFSQMFNSKNSYALRQKELLREEQKRLAGKNVPDDDNHKLTDDEDTSSSDDEEITTATTKTVVKVANADADDTTGPPPQAGTAQETDGPETKDNSIDKTVVSKNVPDNKPKPKPSQSHTSATHPAIAAAVVAGENDPNPRPRQRPPREERSSKSQHERQQQWNSAENSEEDEEGTTSTEKTEASTLADMNSLVLRQELLQNIRAISGATFFDEHDPAALEAIADAVAASSENEHRNFGATEILGGPGLGVGPKNQISNNGQPSQVGTTKDVDNAVSESIFSDEHEFLYFNRKTPSAKSKTKSIDNWIENSHREINNQNPLLNSHNIIDTLTEAGEPENNLNEPVSSNSILLYRPPTPIPFPEQDINNGPTSLPNIQSSQAPLLAESGYYRRTSTGYNNNNNNSSSSTTDNNNSISARPKKLPFSRLEDTDDEELPTASMEKDFTNDRAKEILLLKQNLAKMPPGSYTKSPMMHAATVLPSHVINGLGDLTVMTAIVDSSTNQAAAAEAEAALHEIENDTETKYSIFKRTKQVLSTSRKKFPNSASSERRISKNSIITSNYSNTNSNIIPVDAAAQTVRYNLLPSLNNNNNSVISSPSKIGPSPSNYIRKRKQQQLPQPKLPGVLARQNLDSWVAKIVWFYVNGDEFHPRFEYRFRPTKDVHHFEGLCDILSKRIGLSRGVRYIFTLDGQLIWRLEHLKHGHAYVVSSTRKFKPLDYGRQYAVDMNYDNGHPATAPFNTRNFQQQHQQQLQPMRREHSFNDVQSIRNNYQQQNLGYAKHNKNPTKGILMNNNNNSKTAAASVKSDVERLVNNTINQSSASTISEDIIPNYYNAQSQLAGRPIEKQVILIINGLNPKIHSQVLLNTRVSQEWDDLVKDLGMSVKIPKHFNRVLKTANGKSVLSYSQLRSELRTGNQTFYVFPLKKPPVEPLIRKLDNSDYKELNVAIEREHLRNDMRKLTLDDNNRRSNSKNNVNTNSSRRLLPNNNSNHHQSNEYLNNLTATTFE